MENLSNSTDNEVVRHAMFFGMSMIQWIDFGFNGTFDGQGHTISGLYVYENGGHSCGDTPI